MSVLNVLSYLCSTLRVPKMEALNAFQAGTCSRAFVSFVMRAKVIREVGRTNQGRETTSWVNQALVAFHGIANINGKRIHTSLSRLSGEETPRSVDEPHHLAERHVRSVCS